MIREAMTLTLVGIGLLTGHDRLFAEDPRRDDASREVATEAAFEIVVDDEFERPLFRRRPPADTNGDKPLEVARRFLGHLSKGQFEETRDLCLRDEQQPVRELAGEKEFLEFVDAVRSRVRRVTLSGSPIKGKGGYWHIWYKYADHEGKEYPKPRLGYEGFPIYLRLHEGRWLIVNWPGALAGPKPEAKL